MLYICNINYLNFPLKNLDNFFTIIQFIIILYNIK